jgi:RHS repeat-associated protein
MESNKAERAQQKQIVSPPSVTLPKGGGAIRGIGEKFAANPVTGTGTMTVPIAISPGRSGFGPQLNLSYDSGSGNGPFGFGWSLSLPSITRKTDKGFPQYLDGGKNRPDGDVYILSGAEDLVPVLINDGNGSWTLEDVPSPAGNYLIRRYRPRVEGLFACIERWTERGTGEIHWRSISKDNVTTLYGKDNKSRIFDPVDLDLANPDDLTEAHPKRIFSWLICQSYDDKGNAIIYEHEPEDSNGIDLSQSHEVNRTTRSRSTNRYLKRIKYGNLQPNRDAAWKATDATQLTDWMFEVVFDYLSDEIAQVVNGQHFKELAPDADEQIYVDDPSTQVLRIWGPRLDPFSTYRASFEVRTYRLCRRVLMFHHFPQELGVADYLVRSTEFLYTASPIGSFITSVIQAGYVLQPDQSHPNRYLKKSFPPVEFEYSLVPTSDKFAQLPIRDIDSQSMENLPIGLDGGNYQWVDLDGEGTSGILAEQADGWFYKRNLSANHQIKEDGGERTIARLAALEVVANKPASGLATGAQFLDLAGDGQVDLVQMEGPVRGFYERTDDANWESFQAFSSWPNVNTRDPDLKFVDMTGDGHADILITEGDALMWYPSLAEEGFGPAIRLSLPFDEEQGPRLVFADGEQSIYLADCSGDGLSDIVRIRNGEVCYWPNLGYGRFGSKVTMDNAPWFDASDQFDQKRIRLADTDGSGTTDIIYLHRENARIYFNQSGNHWSGAVTLPQLPPVDNVASVQMLDLLGNGTSCIVWSSPLPNDARRPMRYIALLEDKPHLLIKVKNNLGAETKIYYSPSTEFYLNDKQDGKPWTTRLPFPVHLVERVETYDHISRNRFVTRYAYHHGCFDGEEREFRGFGMVEQLDTEEYSALSTSQEFPVGINVDEVSHVPPVLIRTWFHTGVYLGREHVSNFFAGLLDADDKGEYYREPGLSDAQASRLLLVDTVLPANLTVEEEREACRALKGSMLRQEVYALDGTDKQEHPYTVTEQNFTIECMQPRGKDNRHAVFFTHAREAITYHYERNPVDPRVQHAMTLEVDSYGNVLKSIAIGYGRRPGQTSLQGKDKDRQEQLLVTYTENDITNATDDFGVYPDDYRTPLPAETRTYEITGFALNGGTARFGFNDFAGNNFSSLLTLHEVQYEEPVDYSNKQKRLIERVRTLYRKDNLSGLLTTGVLEPMALPGESYKLAFTPGLLNETFKRGGQNLLPANQTQVLEGGGGERGGYVNLDGDGNWWIPSGKIFLSPDVSHTAADELTFARRHFFLPHRFRDPFHTDAFRTESFVTYDLYDLLMLETRDVLENRVTVGERRADNSIDPTKPGNDYRVLQPRQVMDPNRNRTQVAFDALGMVVGTAVMGKPEEPAKGDTLNQFDADLTPAQIDTFYNAVDPHTVAPGLLTGASTRFIYDLQRFYVTQAEPPFAATLAREIHISNLQNGQQTKIQISFSYSDGFGREIQKKIQAQAGPIPKRNGAGRIILKADHQPDMTDGDVSPRWVGSGWLVHNNKPNFKPVRQFEPFFTDTHRFEFDVRIGVSPILFYDPIQRVVATLHPNHAWEKVVFDPWEQETWDVNDTVITDPRTDKDVKGFFLRPDGTPRIPIREYLPTWYELRANPLHAAEFAAHYPDATDRSNEARAASKASAHAATSTLAHFDTLGRTFLTIAHNKVRCQDHPLDNTEDKFSTRLELDIEGNQRAVRDAKTKTRDSSGNEVVDPFGRIVMQYDYDMLGNRIHQASMESGERWMLNDVADKPFYAWDSRSHQVRTKYDQLRRPIESLLSEGTNAELLVGRTLYGETQSNPETSNSRGKVVKVYDQAGVVTSDLYDFKGNLLRSQRQLAKTVTVQGAQVRAYKTKVDWNTTQIEDETFTSRTMYDALNRSIQLIAPHSDRQDVKVNIIQPVYNEANLLEQVHAWLEQIAEPNDLLNVMTATMHAVTDIDYDAKGQRVLIDYGNGVRTTYSYDPLTFRLVHLLTQRDPAVFPNDCPDPPPDDWSGCQVQNLHYTYEPVGNITHIRDEAQQTIYFNNVRVEPSAEYTYDALYRLIQATGREHLGQAGGRPMPHSYDDASHTGILSTDGFGNFGANDGNALGRYCEKYMYDAVGNIMKISHHRSCPEISSWTRTYNYSETSLIEDGVHLVPPKTSNRLSSTQVGNGVTSAPEHYLYDSHGNTTRMPHLGGNASDPNMIWDYKDQLCQTDLAGGSTAYYMYDMAGQRVRKVWEKSATHIEERIYLGGFEIFRKLTGTRDLELERETLHIMDNKQRIALIERRTIDLSGNDKAPEKLTRYQFSNHLGSASLELDDQSKIISYEEYTPYGSTSYQAVRSTTERPKRYRYTGKERDEESGLYYHGARYYAPWLGRWTNSDKLVDGPNLFSYVRGNPVQFVDSKGTQTEPHPLQKKNQEPNPTSNASAQNEAVKTQNGLVATLATLFRDSGSLQAMDLALRDLYKETNIARASAVTDVIDLYKAIDSDASKAATMARSASDLRNLLRAATQDQLTPVGQALSKLLEKDRSWAQIVKKYGDPFDKTLSAEQRLAIANKIAESSGKSSTAMNALQSLGKGLMVLNVGLSAWQIGGGINKMFNGQRGEGAVDVTEGTVNVSLTIGTYALLKKGVITVGGGGWAATGAGLLAAGSIMLAAEETRRTLRGEKTAALEATEYYADLVVEGEKQGGVKGVLKQAAGWTGGFFSTLIAVGQGY